MYVEIKSFLQNNIFTFILHLDSCDNDSTEGMIEQEMISKPVISISEDLSYVEIETNFLIKIESDYNVQTELSIDNQELISSTEKSFEFTIDPLSI